MPPPLRASVQAAIRGLEGLGRPGQFSSEAHPALRAWSSYSSPSAKNRALSGLDAPDRIRTSASPEGERCHRFEPWSGLDAPDRIRTSASPEGERCHRFEPWSGLDAPDRIRTCDLWFRRPALYPTELRARGRGHPRPSIV